MSLINPVIATAILDRLLHHSITVNIRGESCRIRGSPGWATARGDPTPLNQVPGVEHVLVTAGTGVPTSAIILGRA